MFTTISKLGRRVVTAFATASLAAVVLASSAAAQTSNRPDALDRYLVSHSPVVAPISDNANSQFVARRVADVTPALAAVPRTTSSFDWADAGIGAATALGSTLLALLGFVAATRRRPLSI